MTDIGVGALGYIGFGKEQTEGTAVAPTTFLALDSFSFDDSDELIIPKQIRGERDNVVAMPAPYTVTGTAAGALSPDEFGYMLKSGFAATVQTSAYTGGGYTHVMTPGKASDTFTFEKSAQDVLIMRYTGVRVNTLEIKSNFGEIVALSLGLDGIGREKYTGTAATPTYAASSVYPFTFAGATVKVGNSTSNVTKDVTMSVNNNASHIGTLRGTRAYSRVALGWREVSLSMTMDFQDTTEYDLFLGGTEFAVEYYFEGSTITGGTGKNSLKIAYPRVRFMKIGMPITAGDFLSQAIDCTVLKPNSNVSIATITLVNSQSSLA